MKIFNHLDKNKLYQRVFSFIKKRKKLILGGLILLPIFLLFYAISEALGIAGAIADIVVWKKEIGKTMLALALIPVLAFVFFELSESLLMWVTSPNFLGLDFTLVNPIIHAGWTAVSTLVNMFFILVLVVIAIGIALRLKEYEIKKLLPRFIVAVLLVNFGPVIFALIATGSDVFMNHFLAEIDGLLHFGALVHAEFLGQMLFLGPALAAVGLFLMLPYGWLGALLLLAAIPFWFTEAIFLILFLIVTGIIFILFSALLLARQFAIWILIIISPIAFLLWILPKTAPYARMWWQQFFGWCFVGIPAAFFLYLASILATQPFPGITSMFRMLIVLVFLIIAYILTVKVTPIGAKAIMEAASGGIQRVTSSIVSKGGPNIVNRLKETTGDEKKPQSGSGSGSSRGKGLANYVEGKASRSGIVQRLDQSKLGRTKFGRFVRGTGSPENIPKGGGAFDSKKTLKDAQKKGLPIKTVKKGWGPFKKEEKSIVIEKTGLGEISVAPSVFKYEEERKKKEEEQETRPEKKIIKEAREPFKKKVEDTKIDKTKIGSINVSKEEMIQKINEKIKKGKALSGEEVSFLRQKEEKRRNDSKN